MALLAPVANAVITQYFGPSTLSQEYHYWHVGNTTAMFDWYTGASYSEHFHAGVDFFHPQPAPILAVEAGKVVYAGVAANPGTFAGGGNMVEVAIQGGMHYASCHLASISVKYGQNVTRGQVLGYLGATGNVTGPHDHFAIYTFSGAAPLFRNPIQFMAGGVYQNSPLIKPATTPTYVYLNGPVYVRNQPTTSSTQASLGATNERFVYGGQVTGGSYTVSTGTSNQWYKLWFNNTWWYSAKLLCHF